MSLFFNRSLLGLWWKARLTFKTPLETTATEYVHVFVAKIEVVAPRHRQHIPLEEFWRLAGCEAAVRRVQRQRMEKASSPVTRNSGTFAAVSG